MFNSINILIQLATKIKSNYGLLYSNKNAKL